MKKLVFSLISLITLSLLVSCSSPSYKVTEQEFIDALNLKDVQCIQRIQRTPTSTITWWIAPNICREVEEKSESYVERFIVPKQGATNTWIIKKRTSKTETSYSTEETTNRLWFKTIESDDVMPLKILKSYGRQELVSYSNYVFEYPINTYNANILISAQDVLQSTLQFTNRKVTFCKVLSIFSGFSFGEKFEFQYENITPVLPK